MKQLIKISLITLLLLSVITYSAKGESLNRIIDGDTVVTHSGVKVRLYCIDAPEKRQLEGKLSKETLENLLKNKSFTIKSYSIYKYGRTIGELYIDKESVNLQLVRIGQAVVYPQYCKEKEYYDAQQEAQKSKLGVWASPNFVMPWDFRKKK